VVAGLALALGGCVERSLLIQSDPSGAKVWVNGVDRGTTPVTVRYVHPGRFDVRLQKEGYATVAEEVTTPTTIDAVPGPDFFYENGPWRLSRQTEVTIPLTPLPATRLSREQQRDVLHRAEAFKAEAEAAASEPGTPTPTRPHDVTAPAPTGGTAAGSAPSPAVGPPSPLPGTGK